VSPFGAVPAAVAGNEHHGGSEWQATDFNNEVSADGSRAFFVSPDPVSSSVTDAGACTAEPPCTTAPPELYVRETAPDGSKTTLLVSRSQLSGHVGEAAPDGPVRIADAPVRGAAIDRTYVYASPDGSQAFFASRDRLTEAAPEGMAVKEYAFNVDSGVLTYLPGVSGPIVAASRDGSRFIFKNTATTPEELDLWSAGPNGGSVAQVAKLPPPAEVGEPYLGAVNVEGRASTDGSVFVFDTNAPVPGGFNNQAGYGEVYRYDARANTLTCVSCAPAGVAQTGNAFISYDNGGGTDAKPRSTLDSRVISADGSRVFFDTPSRLVPQAANGKRNVYEWEGGKDYLISSGTSAENAFYLDNSESGNDVFFNTTDGLVAADTDGAYDAYDARVPRPGDTPPPPAAPCQGDACQGSSEFSSQLPAPASATLSGQGNLMPQPEQKVGSARTKLTRAQKLALALRACRKLPPKKRTSCELVARRYLGHASKQVKAGRGGKS
jgi:hypothetical protein